MRGRRTLLALCGVPQLDSSVFPSPVKRGKGFGGAALRERFEGGSKAASFFSDGLRDGSGVLTLILEGLGGSTREGRREGTWVNDRLDGFVFFHPGDDGPTKIERWERGRRRSDGAKERDAEGRDVDR